MLVEDIMNRDVKTISKTENIRTAAELMTKFRIGSLIVTEDNRVVGILTERDILKVVAEKKNLEEVKVEDAMTREVVVVEPDLDIQDAVDVMVERGIKKLPVVKGNRLLGIVTATDICAAEPKIIATLAKLMLMPGRRMAAG